MSVSKRLRTSSFPPDLYLEPQPNTGIVPLFTLVPGSKNAEGSISSIYPILPDVGWSFLKEAFKFDPTKEICYHFVRSTENSGAAGTSRVSAQPPFSTSKSIQVFAPDPKYPAAWLCFVFPVNTDNNNAVGFVEMDTSVNLITSTLELVTGSGLRDVELNFTPGVTSDFDGKDPQSVVYHAVFDNTNPKWCREMGDFLRCTRSGELPTFSIKSAIITSQVVNPKGFVLDSRTVLTKFVLVDKERNIHPCHKEVLEEQCPLFFKMLMENRVRERYAFGKCTATLDLFLDFLYHPLQPLPPVPNFEVAFELVTLASQFELQKLFAMSVKSLCLKLDLADSTQLRELYVFINPLKFKLQICHKLWKALLIKIKIRILEEDDGNSEHFERDASFLNLKSFMGERIFRYELLELLCQDLEKTSENDNPEEVARHLKVQMVINRFKGDVIRKMRTKLMMTKENIHLFIS